MTTILLRFDMRSPAFGAPTGELYRHALDMAAYADEHAFTAVVVSEHHASDDGYLPAPLVLASAMAARTSTIMINVAAILLPLYDPIRLAADMAVLDNVSGGRVSYVIGIGYRPEEYAQFDCDFHTRGRTAEEYVGVLRQAWTGEPFEFDGRTVTVRPVPATQPHPMLCYGGASVAAAERAARLDLPFLPQLANKKAIAAYEEERERLGLGAGLVFAPGAGPLNVFVSEDPDATWAKIGEHLLHDARMYTQWQIDAGLTSVALDAAETVEQLRAGSVYVVLTPDECIASAREHGAITMHPLCGGAPPDVGWESLELITTKVQPAL